MRGNNVGVPLRHLLLAASLCAFSLPVGAQKLEKRGQATQLVVDGKPMLVLGGELGNSSASTREDLAPVWERMHALNLNTLLVPVSWELVEPKEGQFDFALVDGILADARAHDMRIVPLWFGSWKNSISTYVPAWVKRDSKRFPRIADAKGNPVEILSPLSTATRDADTKAFAAFMRHLKEVDSKQRTVIMVQVENEVGMLPDAREHGALGDKAWAGAVPAELVKAMRTNTTPMPDWMADRWRQYGARDRGSWSELFGDDEAAQEIFTAWSLARFVESLAAAGKREYDIPLFVNAALARSGVKPGAYPSGGPLAHLTGVWQIGAPSIDLLAPDIYFPDFAARTADYAAINALFIPEAGRAGEPRVPANAWLAFGKHRAIGFSPFAIDDISGPAADRLRQTYGLMDDIAPMILDAQARGKIWGFAPPVAPDGTVDAADQSFVVDDMRLTVRFNDPWTPKDQQRPDEHGGLILQDKDGDFWFAGAGLTVTFAPAQSGGDAVGIDYAWEGQVDSGAWKPKRLLNGDQTHQGRHIRLPPGAPGLQRVRFYRYR
jgi:beta-galactosidase GanA